MTLSTDVLDAFMRLAGALSPENLHCDGEISRSAALRRERQLRAEWRRLERSHGVTVTEDDVWAQFIASRKAK